VGIFNQHKLQPPNDYEVIRQWLDSGLDPFQTSCLSSPSFFPETCRRIAHHLAAGSILPKKSMQWECGDGEKTTHPT
jgi:hypothetical protein